MNLLSNVVWGIKWGLVYAAIYCAWVVVLIVLNGSLTIPFRKDMPVNALLVMATYLWGGVTAGAVLGLLRPLARHRWGAAMVGLAAGLPVALGVRAGMKGFAPWEGEDTFLLAVFAVFMGGGSGLVTWRIFNSKSTRPARSSRAAGE